MVLWLCSSDWRSVNETAATVTTNVERKKTTFVLKEKYFMAYSVTARDWDRPLNSVLELDSPQPKRTVDRRNSDTTVFFIE